jgi:hypothetical protein
VHRAFTDELRAGEHEQRTTSVTAVQDWLNIRPLDPRNLKALICDALGVDTEDGGEADTTPRLIQPGVERC